MDSNKPSETPMESKAVGSIVKGPPCVKCVMLRNELDALKHDNEAVTVERDELADKVRQLRIIANVNGDWNIKYANAVNERDAALAAVKEYGGHKPWCRYLSLIAIDPPVRRPCSCGLATAIAASERGGSADEKPKEGND